MSTTTPGNRPHTTAVILAGGTGARMAQSVPKQLLQLAGKPVIEYSIAAFNRHEHIDDIVIVMLAEQQDMVRDIVGAGEYTKVVSVISGGQTRTESTIRALEVLATEHHGERANVLIHDAARPLVTGETITGVVTALCEHECVNTAIESTDTIVEVQTSDGQAELMSSTLDRARLRRVQTPQGFEVDVIRRAYHAAATDPDFSATDDCSVVGRYLPEVPIAVVAGDEQNLKITQPLDLVIAEELLRRVAP